MRANTTFICALFIGSLSSIAEAAFLPIPIEFVIAQQLYADATWDLITTTILEKRNAASAGMMQYSGVFDISPDSSNGFSGTYAGGLSGTYLGQVWNHTYDATMAMSSDPSDPTGLAKIDDFSVNSKGKWPDSDDIPEELRGKDFTDKGTIKEDKDGKADVNITVDPPGGDAGHVNGTFKKNEKDKKVKVTGSYEINGHNEKVTITLNEETGKFDSIIDSTFGFWGVKIKNDGDFNVIQDVNGDFHGGISFVLATDVTPVPEPSTYLLLYAGLIGLLSFSPRKKYDRAGRNFNSPQYNVR